MYGNKLGWGISGAIAIVMIGLVVLVEASNRISPPTTFSMKSENLAKVQLPTDPRTIVTTVMTQDCDAGDHYRQAITAYRGSAAMYENFATGGRSTSPEIGSLTAVNKIIEGARCSRMTLFAKNPAELINYDNERPPLDAISTLGAVTVRLALIHRNAGREEEARRHYEAAFALGHHLYEERVTYAEMLAGLGLMGDGALGLATIEEKANNKARADVLRSFDFERTEYVQQRILPVYRILSSIDPNVIGRHAGDVFHFAGNSPEKMWRVEAILKLGRMKYQVGAGGRAGDQRGARRYVRELSKDTSADPHIRAAAQAANDLTLEKYRMMR